MGHHLLRTLEAHPQLAGSVTYFAAQHTSEGCYQLVSAPFSEEHAYGTVEERCAPLAVRTVRLLSHLTALDLSRLTPKRDDVPVWQLLFTHPRGEPFDTSSMHGRLEEELRVEGLASLQYLSVHLWDAPARKLLPFLKMDGLRTLEVDMRRRGRNFLPHTHGDRTGTRVEHLRIIGCGASRQADVRWLAEELGDLSTLFLAAKELGGSISMLMMLFGGHLRRGVVRSVQVAVVGLWRYEVEFETGEEDQVYARSCVGALMYATGRAEVEGRVVEVGTGYPGVTRVVMKELSEEEKKAYDLRPSLVRRP